MERRRTGWEVQADKERLFTAWTHTQTDPLPSLVITSSRQEIKMSIPYCRYTGWKQKHPGNFAPSFSPSVTVKKHHQAKSWSQLPQCRGRETLRPSAGSLQVHIDLSKLSLVSIQATHMEICRVQSTEVLTPREQTQVQWLIVISLRLIPPPKKKK